MQKKNRSESDDPQKRLTFGNTLSDDLDDSQKINYSIKRFLDQLTGDLGMSSDRRALVVRELMKYPSYEAGSYATVNWSTMYSSLQGSTTLPTNISSVTEEMVIWLPSSSPEVYILMVCILQNPIVQTFALPSLLSYPTGNAPTLVFTLQNSIPLNIIVNQQSTAPSECVNRGRSLVSAYCDMRADNSSNNAIQELGGTAEGFVASSLYGPNIRERLLAATNTKCHQSSGITSRMCSMLFPDKEEDCAQIRTMNLWSIIGTYITAGNPVLVANFGMPTMFCTTQFVYGSSTPAVVILDENDVIPYCAVPWIEGSVPGYQIFHVYLRWYATSAELFITSNGGSGQNLPMLGILGVWIGVLFLPTDGCIPPSLPPGTKNVISSPILTWKAYTNVRIVSFRGLQLQPIVVTGTGIMGAAPNTQAQQWTKEDMPTKNPHESWLLKSYANNPVNDFKRLWIVEN